MAYPLRRTIAPHWKPVAVVDDRRMAYSRARALPLHEERVPVTPASRRIQADDVPVIHLQWLLPRRNQVRQAWYRGREWMQQERSAAQRLRRRVRGVVRDIVTPGVPRPTASPDPGPYALVRSVVEGLRAIGADFNFNSARVSELARVVYAPANEALLQGGGAEAARAHRLSRRRPGQRDVPRRRRRRAADAENDRLLVAHDWAREFFRDSPALLEMVTRAARRIVHRIRAGGRALGNRRRVVALQGQRSLRVHLGCGDDRLPGFVNIDAPPTDAVDVAMDLSLPPLADGSVSLAFSNAFFEHLYRSGREPHLRRIREALAPDGVCCYMGIPLCLSRRRKEMPVTMGFYATREVIAAADLRRRCLSFLEAFADTRIRLATLEWLFTP